MAFFLYRPFPPSPYSHLQKQASLRRQWLLQIPLLFLFFPTAISYYLSLKGFVRYGELFSFESLPYLIYNAFFSLASIIGQLLIVREVLIYRTIWLGRSIFNRGRFWTQYGELEKPISLISSLMIQAILLYLLTSILFGGLEALSVRFK